MINKKRLFSLLSDLIAIDSQNPPGNEAKIADFLKDYFLRLGLEVKLYAFAKNRINVLARLKGKGAKQLLITPHLDTVPAGAHWTCSPFKATLLRGKLYGLGATDCKVNLACAMECLNSLVEDKKKLGYNLLFAATADEESGSALGLIPLLKKNLLPCDAAVVLDSDDFEIIVVQKGLFHLKVKLRGKRAHGAYPWLGKNAIDAAVKILAEIKAFDFSAGESAYLKHPTVNIGTIRGGDKVNIVADWCEFELDFRYLPGMTAEAFLQRVKAVIKKHSKSFSVEIEGIQKPYAIAKEHPLVSKLIASMKHFSLKPQLKGSEGATVITFFQDYRIPAIATGFGSAGCAHIVNEYVKAENVYKGAKVLEHFLEEFTFDE